MAFLRPQLLTERLGAVTMLPPVSMGLLRLTVAWAIAVAILSVVTRREARGAGDPRYRIDGPAPRIP